MGGKSRGDARRAKKFQGAPDADTSMPIGWAVDSQLPTARDSDSESNCLPTARCAGLWPLRVSELSPAATDGL